MAGERAERPAYSKWLADVAATPDLKPSTYRIALRVGAIGMGRNDGGARLYFESLDTLVKMTGLSKNTVRAAVRELVSVGLLDKIHDGGRGPGGRGRANRYALRLNAWESKRMARLREVEETSTPVAKGPPQTGPFIEKGSTPDGTLSKAKGSTPDGTVYGERVQSESERVQSSDQKGPPQTGPESLRILKKNAPSSDGELSAEMLARRRRMLKAQAQNEIERERRNSGGRP